MTRVKAKGYGQYMFHEAQMHLLAIIVWLKSVIYGQRKSKTSFFAVLTTNRFV